MINIKKMAESHIETIVSKFSEINWNKPKPLFQKYLKEQNINERQNWVAFYGDSFAGYCTLRINSSYKSFYTQNIPEIMDLNVLPLYRKKGIGSSLISYIENFAQKINYKKIGLGVGLSKDYGSAQRLYIKLGYIPDGLGITYKYNYVKFNANTKLDDDLILWLVKDLT